MSDSKYDDILIRGILCVDDEEDILDFLEMYLSSNGFKNIYRATSPIEAIAKLSLAMDRIFLVLTDIRMPEMDGFEMVQHIINAHPIPVGVIFMTGFSYDPTHSYIDFKKENSIENECIFKPFNREKILKSVTKSLNSVYQKRLEYHQKLDDKIGDEITKKCAELTNIIKCVCTENMSLELSLCLHELKSTFYLGCYLSSLAISGRILEICLKYLLTKNSVKYDDNWMVGNLLKTINESGLSIKLHSSLNNVANIINQYRITSVHSKMNFCPPNRDIAISVIYAVLDLMNITFPK